MSTWVRYTLCAALAMMLAGAVTFVLNKVGI
jgi:hypothetical protein